MALTAAFGADFTQFDRALKSATIQLQTFDRATKTAVRDLKRETESFSGQRLAVEAARMSEAVERVGGVSKLTQSELARVATTVHEFTAKMAAMGQQVPPHIQKLSAELSNLGHGANQATGFFGGLTGIVGKLGPILPIASVAGAATALIGMGKAAFESASQVANLSSATGLSTTTIQRMQAVANQTGTTVEAFTSAAFKLGVNVAEGTEKARKSVAALGLSYEQLRQQQPEAQFAAVVKALENVDSTQERNRLGVALFGKQYAEIAVAIEQGYSEIADAASVSSDAQIRALDRAGNAWQKFKDDASSAMTSILGEAVLTAQGVKEAFETLPKIDLLKILSVGFAGGQRPEDILIAMGRGMSEVADRGKDIELSSKGAAAATEELGGAAKEAAKNFEEFNRRVNELSGAKALKDAQEAIKQLAAAGGPSRVLDSQLKGLADVFNRAAEAALKLGNVGLADQYRDLAKTLSPVVQFQQRYNVTIGEFITLNPSYTGALQEQLSLLEKQPEAINLGILATTQWTAAWAPFKAAVQSAMTELDGSKFARFAADMKAGLGEVLSDIPQLIANVITHGGNWTQAVKGIVSQIGSAIGSAIGIAFGPLGEKIGGAIGSLAGLIVNPFKKLFGIGINEEVKKANKEIQKLRDELIDTHGSLTQLEAKARALGLSFQENWGHQGQAGLKAFNDLIKEFEKRLRDANAQFAPLLQSAEDLGIRLPDALLESIGHLVDIGVLLDDNAQSFARLAGMADVDWKKMQDAAEKYGVDLASLGKAFQSNRLHASAQQIINDFDLLTRGGADVGGVLFGMKDEISALVNDSKRFGTEIPKNMEPWIRELLRAGLLTDENGEALTDLKDIKFGDALKTEFQKVIDKLQELIDKITHGLNPAIGNIPAPRLGQIDPGDGSTRPPIETFQTGTLGRYGSLLRDFGRGTPAMLHGKEAVLTEQQLKALSASIFAQAIKAMGREERHALALGAKDFAGSLEAFLSQQALLYTTAGEGDPLLKTWLSADTLDRLSAARVSDVFIKAITRMGYGERAALADGMRDYPGTVTQFLAEQAALYQHAKEGDPRLRTWLSGGTLDLIKSSIEGAKRLTAIAATQGLSGLLSVVNWDRGETARRKVRRGNEDISDTGFHLGHSVLTLQEATARLNALAAKHGYGPLTQEQLNMVADTFGHKGETHHRTDLVNQFLEELERRYITSRQVPSFADGSDGLRDFGRGTLAVLHGRETVLTEKQLNALTTRSNGDVTLLPILIPSSVDAGGIERGIEERLHRVAMSGKFRAAIRTIAELAVQGGR